MMFGFFKTKESEGSRDPIEVFAEIERDNFIKDYCLCLNPENPAPEEDRFSEAVWDKRYTWGNLCTPEGYCYLFKVKNEEDYMTKIKKFFEDKLLMKQRSLYIYSPEAGDITKEQKEKAEKLKLLEP